MKTKHDIRQKITEDQETDEKNMQRIREQRNQIRALLELIPDDMMAWLNPYDTRRLTFRCYDRKGMDAVRFFRGRLRQAFGEWSDDRFGVPFVTETMVDVDYKHKTLPVFFTVEFSHEEFGETLDDDCRIEATTGESTSYSIVCGAKE